MNPTDALRNISQIIQREDKTSTYKFALLRSTIETILENSPFITIHEEGYVSIPTGLLVEKWLYYYYPLFLQEPPVRQIKSSERLAFGQAFQAIMPHYRNQGGLSKLREDIRAAKIPAQTRMALQELLLKIQETIVKMPMSYLGTKVHGATGQVFWQILPRSKRSFDLSRGISSMILHLGRFAIPRAYYEAFMLYGSFIAGQDNLLVQWARLSEKMSNSEVSTSEVLNLLTTSPVTERQNSGAEKVFEQMHRERKLTCVWTGRHLDTWDVDHLIPFSVWKNNDLWNMLPCNKEVNRKKSDDIPAPEMWLASRPRIIDYWEKINSFLPNQFQTEIRLALIGNNQPIGWQEIAFDRILHNADLLITQRGHNPWSLKT